MHNLGRGVYSIYGIYEFCIIHVFFLFVSLHDMVDDLCICFSGAREGGGG